MQQFKDILTVGKITKKDADNSGVADFAESGKKQHSAGESSIPEEYDIVFAADFDRLEEEVRRMSAAIGQKSGQKFGQKSGQKGTAASDIVRAGSDSFPYSAVCIVTDYNVERLYLAEVLEKLEPLGVPVMSYVIPAGEEHKNLDEIRKLYAFLIDHHFDRRSLLAALGGGVIGDMTGFAAATYLRGIDFIQIPTTLLAQADSSIGGKTGVDFDGYKNMVGAFKMPRLVYENASALKSLDGRQFSSGFAEIMKAALIRDEDFYLWLIDHMYEILDRDPRTLQTMLYNADYIKRQIVENDPYEHGERRLLNFGHTLGHAIEKYKNFTLTHGECVALGCVAAAYISWKKERISMEEYYEIRDMFVPFGLPISVENLEIDKVVSLAHSDKKAVGSTLPFILLNGVGNAFVSLDVSDEELRAALREILWVEDGE